MTEINESGQYMTTEYDAWPLIPEEVAREVVAGITEASATLSMFRRLPNMSARTMRMPVLNALGSAAFTTANTENDSLAGADQEVDDTQQAHLKSEGELPIDDAPGLKDTHQMEWKNTFINAEPLAIILPIAEDTIADSQYPIWNEIQPRIVEAFGALIDTAVVWGQGRPATWPTGIVPTSISRGFTIVEGAGADLSIDVSDLMGTLEGVGYDANGFIADPGMKASLRGLRDNNGGLLFQPSLVAGTPSMLYGNPVTYLKNGSMLPATSRLIAGDMTQAVYSVRQDMSFKVFTEGVVTDSNGVVIMNLMQQDMIALRVVMRMGWAVPNPIHALATRANRYPFATLAV